MPSDTVESVPVHALHAAPLSVIVHWKDYAKKKVYESDAGVPIFSTPIKNKLTSD